MLEWIVAAAVSATSPANSIVLDADTRADVRCVIALSREAGEATAEQINGLAVMTFYFIGRIDGRNTKLDLGAAFEQEGAQMAHVEYVSSAATCRERYGHRAGELNAAAKALSD